MRIRARITDFVATALVTFFCILFAAMMLPGIAMLSWADWIFRKMKTD